MHLLHWILRFQRTMLLHRVMQRPHFSQSTFTLNDYFIFDHANKIFIDVRFSPAADKQKYMQCHEFYWITKKFLNTLATWCSLIFNTAILITILIPWMITLLCDTNCSNQCPSIHYCKTSLCSKMQTINRKQRSAVAVLFRAARGELVLQEGQQLEDVKVPCHGKGHSYFLHPAASLLAYLCFTTFRTDS